MHMHALLGHAFPYTPSSLLLQSVARIACRPPSYIPTIPMTVNAQPNGGLNGTHHASSHNPSQTSSQENTTTGRLWVRVVLRLDGIQRRRTLSHLFYLVPCTQLEEDLGDHLKWSMLVSRVLHTGQSPYQTMELLQTPAFGKV